MGGTSCRGTRWMALLVGGGRWVVLLVGGPGGWHYL